MFKLTFGEIAAAVNAVNTEGDPGTVFCSVSTDTRKIVPGSIFIALKGERFDGHDFIDQAVSGGAGGVMVSRPVSVPKEVAVLQVADTLMGLQKLANYNRSKFKGPLIAVTGSNGKTTTKDFIAAVLSRRFRVLKTTSNLNNEIGLPLTILNLDESYDAVVLEMGMRGLGEIDLLARIAAPTAGVITNIGESHLERLGSVENIAKAKTELLPHLPSKGYAILNGDDPWLRKYAHLSRCKVIFYGMGENAELSVRQPVVYTEKGIRFAAEYKGKKTEYDLPVPGIHNVYNAMAAIAVGLQEGLSSEKCAEGLKSAELTGMRLEVIEHGSFKIINDAYNASPLSTKASLGILAEMPGNGRNIAVLGEMYELGDRTEIGHREVGERVASLGLDILIGVGPLAKDICLGAQKSGMEPTRVFYCANNEEALETLKGLLKPGDRILVKGSRGMKMEEVVQGIISD